MQSCMCMEAVLATKHTFALLAHPSYLLANVWNLDKVSHLLLFLLLYVGSHMPPFTPSNDCMLRHACWVRNQSHVHSRPVAEQAATEHAASSCTNGLGPLRP